MPKEIERKFLVIGSSWRQAAAVRFWQGYLNTDPERTVRVRVAGDEAFLTIKGKSFGYSREEFEYPLPLNDAEELLKLCEKPVIDKDRRIIASGGFTWEVDEFHGENEGLVLAEIELESEDQEFPRPDWIGEEVTGDPRYYNAHLVATPFSRWKERAPLIFHITTEKDLTSAREAGAYTAPSLEEEGFIHCSGALQVADTANLLFRGRLDLIVLSIDRRRVTADIGYEQAEDRGHNPGTAKHFPHIYGPLNLDAVTAVIPFPCGPDGRFSDFRKLL